MIYQPIKETDCVANHANGWPLEGLRLSETCQHLREARDRDKATRYLVRYQYTRGHTLETWREDYRRFAIVTERAVEHTAPGH